MTRVQDLGTIEVLMRILEERIETKSNELLSL